MHPSRQNSLLWEDIVQQLEFSTDRLLSATTQVGDGLEAALALRSSAIQQLTLHNVSFCDLAKEAQVRLLTRATRALADGSLAVQNLEKVKHEAFRDCNRGNRLRLALVQQNPSGDADCLELVG